MDLYGLIYVTKSKKGWIKDASVSMCQLQKVAAQRNPYKKYFFSAKHIQTCQTNPNKHSKSGTDQENAC